LLSKGTREREREREAEEIKENEMVRLLPKKYREGAWPTSGKQSAG